MAIPIKPADFSQQSDFQVVEDRGIEGKLDREDVVVKDGAGPDAPPVDWNDPELVTAREKTIEELILEPHGKYLGEISEGLKPGQKDPHFESRRAKIESAIATLKELLDNPELPADLRSQACLALSGFEGRIAGQGENKDLGKVSFGHLAEAHEIDPDNAVAWGMYGMVLLGFTHRNWVMRKLITCEKGLNIDLDDEFKKTVTNLNRLSESPEAQCYLHAILADRARTGDASAIDEKILATAESRLETFRSDPETANRIDELQANLRVRVADMS